MAVYEYTAKDEGGREFTGTYDGVGSVAVLREELSKTGYVLLKASRQRGSAQSQRRKKISRAEVVAFAYKFAGMYSAGLPILTCLETLQEQAENYTFRYVITEGIKSVEAGSNLEGAFRKHRDIFSDFFLGMVEAGESGGKLATALEMSAEYLEKQFDLKRRIKSAFAYPIIVGVICLIVVGFLLVFVVPVFSKLYKQLHVTLPGPTQVLMNLSFVIRDQWWAVLIAIPAAVIMLYRLSKNPTAKARWDAFKLDMPVFARLNRMIVVSHFTRTFAMLISVGVSLIKALDVAGVVVNNHKLTEITRELQASIKAGNSVSKSIQSYNIFPPVVTQLAISGEESGRLPEMLNKGADFLDKDIDRMVNALLAKLEPILTVIMGVIVGFLLLAVYLPMFDYMAYLE